MGVVLKTKTVTIVTAGTRVPLLANTDAQHNIVGATITPLVNPIVFGDATTLASTGVGQPVAAGVSFQIAVGDNDGIDLAKVYVDSTTSGTKVNLNYLITL